MHIILVGGGKIGSALCHSLVDENHDVTLIDEKETVIKHLTKHYDLMGIVGNGVSHLILNQAGVSNCDIFIAMTAKDEVNMIAAALAKQMGAKETIVRVRNPEYSNSYFKNKNFLGFSLIINPELLTAGYIANNIAFPNAKSVEHFANGRIVLMEFSITQETSFNQLSVRQFRKQFDNLLICAIKRQKTLLIPDGDEVLQAGDRIFVTGNRLEMVEFHNAIKSKLIKNLLIIGAGRIGYYLLTLLKQTKVKLKVIEKNPQHAKWLSQAFPKVHLVVGDGTAKDVLQEEGAEHYDAVATLMGVDEENILTSLFLEKSGVTTSITKVNRTSLLDIIDHDFLSASVMVPKNIAADTVMQFIRGRVNAKDSNLDAMHHLANGQIETLQFEIKPESLFANQKLTHITLKEHVMIAAIIRNGKPIYPSGDDIIAVGDKLIIFTLLKNITHIRDLVRK